MAKISYRYDEEHVVCYNCREFFNADEFSSMDGGVWNCPTCNDKLRIYASRGVFSPVFIRPNVHELEEGDFVQLISDRDKEDPHEILAIEDLYDGTYSVAIKGYRKINLDEDGWVNCRVGSWNGDKKSILG